MRLNRLRDLRRKAGLTLEDVAEKTGIPTSTLCAMERSGGEVLIRNIHLAELYGVTVEELYAEFEKPAEKRRRKPRRA